MSAPPFIIAIFTNNASQNGMLAIRSLRMRPVHEKHKLLYIA